MLESSLGVKIDDYVGNFMYDQNDNLVYVDSFNPWKFNVWDQGVGKINFNVEKLREAIEKLDEDKKRKGMVYLERLIQLAKEEGILIVAEQQSKA